MNLENPDDDPIPLMSVPEVLGVYIPKSQLNKWVNVGVGDCILRIERRGNQRFVYRAELCAFLRELYGDDLDFRI